MHSRRSQEKDQHMVQQGMGLFPALANLDPFDEER